MSLPSDYVERVYAGVLGKLIGVYLGRPFEGWTHQRILSELGEIRYYVHDRLGAPLIVTDDDLTGTFTFLRALPDHGNRRDLTSAQIGESWLNYILEGKTILWWGGLGHATEHTAFLRLKRGIPAPESGSIRRNGKTIAEQIGAQIFIDGWALVAPNDPAFAADLAGRAARVSHDGEALYAAQLWAAMESAAFSEPNLDRLLDIGLSLIPADCTIRRMIDDLRDLRAAEPDWYRARARFADRYNYEVYPGACHVVPNHGVMILSLLYGDDDFSRVLSIVNTCGWDTDCNSGNVGCLMGIKNGLAALDSGPDWRGPLADRLYLPTAEGGRAITDALRQTYHIVNIGRALAGLEALRPKDGARFHFEGPGAVQGFVVESGTDGALHDALKNVEGYSVGGRRSLAICAGAAGQPVRVSTATFIPPDARQMRGYDLLAAPTLYPGQTVRARVVGGTAQASAHCGLYLTVYGPQDALQHIAGPAVQLAPGAEHILTWRVPQTDNAPIASIGLEVEGAVLLDYLTWDGEPETVFGRGSGSMWQRAWVEGVYRVRETRTHPFHLVQNEGTGLLMTGTDDWRDYHVSAAITPSLCDAAGVALRVGGMRRYYALLLCTTGDQRVARLVRAADAETVLAEVPFAWEYEATYRLSLQAVGEALQGWIDDQPLLSARDDTLQAGGIALVIREGCVASGEVRVQPAG